MKELLEKLFVWLEKNLPILIGAFSLGYKKGSKDSVEVEKKLEDVSLELERERNRRAIEEANKVFDNRSIVSRAISKGRDLLRGKR